MICPKCNAKVVVTDSVNNPATNETYRKRKCLTCGHIFYTVEYEMEYDETLSKEWNVNYRKCKRSKKK